MFVEDLDEIPDPPPPGAVVVFSAWGFPAVRAGADERGLQVVDATCPLKVTLKPHGLPPCPVIRWSSSGAGWRPKAQQRRSAMQHYWWNTADVAALNLPRYPSYRIWPDNPLALDETVDVIDALRARFPTLGSPLKTSAMPPRTGSVRCNRWSVVLTLCW